uniref:Uncharacterized protein n=1 Tax=Arundo donax TaxID=35708 RepID=A0A0A9H940_ARUDO
MFFSGNTSSIMLQLIGKSHVFSVLKSSIRTAHLLVRASGLIKIVSILLIPTAVSVL